MTFKIDTEQSKIAHAIQNNLRDAILVMMHAGHYQIKDFGTVMVAYSDTPGPDYNLVFYYAYDNANAKDLEAALEWAHLQRYPFLLVIDHEKPISKVQDLITKFTYEYVGTATKMALLHENFHFNSNSLVTVKKVESVPMFKAYCDIIDAAFGREPDSSFNFMQPMDLLGLACDLQLYVAYLNVNHQPLEVAASMLYLPANKQNPAGHYAWAVKKDYRKHGIMTNLVNHMVQEAQTLGYSLSVAQCFADSVGLARKVGFEPYGELYLYVNRKTS